MTVDVQVCEGGWVAWHPVCRSRTRGRGRVITRSGPTYSRHLDVIRMTTAKRAGGRKGRGTRDDSWYHAGGRTGEGCGRKRPRSPTTVSSLITSSCSMLACSPICKIYDVTAGRADCSLDGADHMLCMQKLEQSVAMAASCFLCISCQP